VYKGALYLTFNLNRSLAEDKKNVENFNVNFASQSFELQTRFFTADLNLFGYVFISAPSSSVALPLYFGRAERRNFLSG